MNATFLSRFTPSMMTPEALESLFVQREELAQRLVELIRESALTPAKHHTLLIGPRGIGKTHLISLIYHRIRAMEDLRDRLLIAWLREEEWGVTSFLDMLLRVFRALLAERADALLAERVESLYGLPPETAERMAGALLKEFVGGRTVLILVENLDDLFKGIGASGQKSWRAYLQGHQFCTMLATSQSLFNGVSLRTSPFYGFFRVNHLEELTLDEAVRLLTNIAELEGDQELASFIQTATGRARVLAVQHIAGGNFRIYAIFSQFLSRKSLDELVEPFMRLLDDLTPYYQSRMAWLSPQQRKIVEFLCDRRGAATVREIAQRCFLSQQTASSQLKILRDMCYVHSIAIGRESFYELHEPLMRLCVEVKKNRGEPIRLLMEFLRLWYSQDELRQRLEGLHPDAVLEREYLSQVLRGTEAEPEDPQVAACLKDFTAHIEAGDFAQAMVAAKELLVIRNEPNDWIRLFICLISLGHLKDASALLGKVIGTEPTTIELVLGSFAIGLSLVTLFLSTNDSEGWRKHIMSLIDFSDQSPQFSACAPMAITWSIPSLRSPDVEEAKAQRWLSLWQEMAGHRAEFKLPLRLMDAAICYRKTQDQRIILNLAVEERILLKPLLGTG